MRLFTTAAEIVMGVILGAFLYAALSRTWPGTAHPAVAAVVLAACVVLVLFRRPSGSMVKKRRDESSP